MTITLKQTPPLFTWFTVTRPPYPASTWISGSFFIMSLMLSTSTQHIEIYNKVTMLSCSLIATCLISLYVKKNKLPYAFQNTLITWLGLALPWTVHFLQEEALQHPHLRGPHQ